MTRSATGRNAASEPASVRVELMEIPTYVPGPDSPFPDYIWTSGTHLERYPYSLRMDMSGQATPVKHTVVILENRYIRVTLLPEIGGRVFSLFDKIGGKECFMTPPSLKYQNISQRGAWLAGGVEFNAGFHHHTVNSVFPVTWSTEVGGDGTAALWVGSLTMPLESRWSVKVSLKPDRAVMDLEIHYQGPDALPGLYYWWTNTAVEVTHDSRFYYFGKRALHHGWPICDGLDYSWYRNRLTGSDMFLMECQRDYLGFYDFSRQHGVASTADRFHAPGQKYFTWGNHELGRYWDTMFSDAGQAYCEIQRGRHATQGVNDFIDPMSEDVWRESWAPLNQTNGFDAFENDFVLSVVNEGQREIRLTSLRPRQNLRVEASWHGRPAHASGGRLGPLEAAEATSIGQWTVAECSPEAMFVQPITSHCDAVKVFDAQGELLLDWEEFKYVEDDQTGTHPAPNLPVPANPETAESLFYQAQWQRFIYWPRYSQEAMDLFSKALAMDPGHVGTLQAMAETSLYQGLYEQALEQINKALLRDTMNGSLLCLQGRTLLAMGKAREAFESFAQAGRREPFRRRGCVGMAEAAIAMGDWAGAEQAVERISKESNDKWADWLGALIARRQGRADEAKASLARLLKRDPLWTRLHAETMLLGVPVDLGAGRKLGDDSVSAAMPYFEMGLWDDALKILQVDESNEPFSPAVRLAHLAYVQEKLGQAQEAKATLQAANAADAAQANPWHTRSIDILKDLAARHDGVAMLHLMRGNVLASRNRNEEAQAAWQKAADLKMATPIVYRNLACLEIRDGRKEPALELYEKAWSLGRGDLNLFGEFDRLLASAGRHEHRLEVYEQLPSEAKARSMVANRHVIQLLDVERYEEAMQELMTREFFRAEHEYGTRYYYVEAVVGLALKDLAAKQYEKAVATLRRGLEYPRNINIGRNGIWPNESMAQYLMGACRDAMGQKAEAREHYLLAAHEPHWEYHIMESYEMLAWMALDQRFRAVTLAHKLEEGYRKHLASWWGAAHIVNFGLAQAVKGHIDVARAKWKQGLADAPDGRYLRLHLAMPEWVLTMMGRKS